MRLHVLILTSILVSCIGCKSQEKKPLQEVIIELKNFDKDTCIRLIENGHLQKIYREIEIIENDLTDTVVIGFSAIPPKKKERFVFIQVSEDVTKGVYFDRDHPVSVADPESYSEMFCTYHYQGRKAGGSIKLKLRVLKE